MTSDELVTTSDTTAPVQLTSEQEATVTEIVEKLDLNDPAAVSNFGTEAQQSLGDFSQKMLDQVQSQDTGAIGDALTSLMTRLNEANPDELRAENSNIFKRIFGRMKRSIYEMTAKYQKIGAQIDTIATRLDKSQLGLQQDNAMLDSLYAQNKATFEDLNLHIVAGDRKLSQLQQQLQEVLATPEDAGAMPGQTAEELRTTAARLEKRVHDLRLAREITLQQAPQIRLIQNTNQTLAEKIQASVHTAIPLWKNQVAIALTLLRQKDAVTAQRQVSETTNELLKKNAEMLKVSAIETAKENERGVVDIETLKQTQGDLIETLQETLKIQQDGHARRQSAENDLLEMESELKQQLLAYATAESEPKKVN